MCKVKLINRVAEAVSFLYVILTGGPVADTSFSSEQMRGPRSMYSDIKVLESFFHGLNMLGMTWIDGNSQICQSISPIYTVSALRYFLLSPPPLARL